MNLETLYALHYSFRDWDFRLNNLDSLTVLTYFFRDSKCFALLIQRL